MQPWDERDKERSQIGALTVFFDFLDNPIITLGVPASVLLFLNRELVSSHSQQGGLAWRITRMLGFLIALCACWALGYALLWACKWVLSSAIAGQDLVAPAIDNLFTRSGNLVGDEQSGLVAFSRADMLIQLVHMIVPEVKPFLVLCVVVLAALAVIVKAARTRLEIAWIVPQALIAALPYLWSLAAANHSYIHYWFVYRNQLVTLVAVALVLGTVVHEIWSAHRRPFRAFTASASPSTQGGSP